MIREALSKSPSESLTGLILFGADAQREWLPSEGRTFQNFQARPDPDGTEIAGALRLATALFPPGYARRIVLLSDGNETSGLARTTAEVARTESIAIDTVLLPTAVGANEVLLEQVELPSTVKVGEPFPVRMTIRAQDDAEARRVLDREGTPVKTLNGSLSPGVNLPEVRAHRGISPACHARLVQRYRPTQPSRLSPHARAGRADRADCRGAGRHQ